MLLTQYDQLHDLHTTQRKEVHAQAARKIVQYLRATAISVLGPDMAVDNGTGSWMMIWRRTWTRTFPSTTTILLAVRSLA